jgi:hypothetical protein
MYSPSLVKPVIFAIWFFDIKHKIQRIWQLYIKWQAAECTIMILFKRGISEDFLAYKTE